MKNILLPLLMLLLAAGCRQIEPGSYKGKGNDLTLRITKQYLNFPVSHSVERSKISFKPEGTGSFQMVLRLAPAKPDYWVFLDVSAYKGQDLKITYDGSPAGLAAVYQSDEIAGSDSLYHERFRPQVHFSSRRGWNNDPNGLVFYEGEYHLFYQHNPLERDWENMSWGHAVSTDLIHWQELPVVMYPDSLGAVFSGTAVIDYSNSSGFAKDGTPPMVAIYTSHGAMGERQSIAYSLDRGRTFTRFEGNPVIDSKARWNSADLRDPKVFWYEPSKSWVMVLFEKDGNSIYTSGDLKSWTWQSHVPGFWECPQLFELPVDGNTNTKKWVMYGASGTYMTGSFDGRIFTPEAGKYYYGNGALYAAQTFENIPASDGRRIQIGWGRISHPGMPFNQMFLIPTELTLRKTKEGIRLFSYPVREIDLLNGKISVPVDASPEAATALLNSFRDSSAIRIKTRLKLSHATDAGIRLNGQDIFRYDMNFNLVNGAFYSPEDRTSMEISADIIIDRTSVEVFVDNGAFSYAIERKPVNGDKTGFTVFGNRIEVEKLEVCALKPIWK